jgi:D-sedoheptulose 7-phosphate isomerase
MRELPLDGVDRALALLEDAYRDRRGVWLVGNGGSAATASHMANDLMLGVGKDGAAGLGAVSLAGDPAVLTAIANDAGYERVFDRQIEALAEPGDVLIAITSSGNSENVLRAVECARRRGLHTIGLLGMGGGAVAPLCDAAIVVPSDDPGAIEDAHMALDHLITAYLRAWAAGEGTE